MTLVTVPQSNPNDEITALAINQGPNAIAAVLNGQVDDANISSISGSKIAAGTILPSSFSTSSNPEIRQNETVGNFLASGAIWSPTTGLLASMTAGIAYITGKRIVLVSIATRTFTALKDTYVSVSINGLVGYQETTNGGTAPTLPADNIWLAIVITNGTAVVAVDGISLAAPTVGVIARRTLGAAASSISIQNIPARRNLRVIVFAQAVTGTLDSSMRFNNDSGNNYSWIISTDFGASSATISTSAIPLDSATVAVGGSETSSFDINNVATAEKLLDGINNRTAGGGAGTTPVRLAVSAKWANAATQITRVDVINAGTGNYGTGSEVIVIGWDY